MIGVSKVVQQEHPVWPSMQPLIEALDKAADGECVAYAVPLNTPIARRLLTLATFRWQRWRAERALTAGGARLVARLAVDPSLAQPAWYYELDTPAAEYAERYMRPRGSSAALRRAAVRWFGCDPALGGVLVVGRKR